MMEHLLYTMVHVERHLGWKKSLFRAFFTKITYHLYSFIGGMTALENSFHQQNQLKDEREKEKVKTVLWMEDQWCFFFFFRKYLVGTMA